MGFSQSVTDKVLTACGRHCSICHKFCGLKIELHHIVQKKDGGPDTYDNCIPLCFDCHGDMRSYDHLHPKGRKYSTNELVAHREVWYSKYSATGGAVSHPGHAELDKATFLRLREDLPYDTLIRNLKDRYVGAPFFNSKIQLLHRFLPESDDPSYEFLDSDLEGLRARLVSAIDSYTENVAQWTFPSDGDVNVLPPEMKHTDTETYYERARVLSKQEIEIVCAYEDIVRAGRRKLAVDIEES